MQENKLSAQVRHEGTVSIIDLEGDINRSSDEIFQTAYEETAKKGATQIVLNFSKVGFINSTGIAVIVSFLARARAAKQDLVVFGLTEHYQRIFEITRLVDFMSVLPDEASALQHTSNREN
jgi:anti-anti-sigma factor